MIFQDGKIVFVRHGGVYARISVHRLQKTDSGTTINSTEETDESSNHNISNQTAASDSESEDQTQSVIPVNKVPSPEPPIASEISQHNSPSTVPLTTSFSTKSAMKIIGVMAIS